MKVDPARRAAARRQVAQLRERMAAMRAEIHRKRPPSRRRRWGWLALLALLLLLLLLLRSCPPEPAPEEPAVGPAAASGPAPPPPPPPEPAPTGKVTRGKRPDYTAPDPGALPWIGALRMAVAARSPRLAACFVGADQPGRIAWSASMDPVTGIASDQVVEPLGAGFLTPEQRTCVLGVLSDPPYVLGADAGRSTPSQVRLVLEF